YGADLEGSAERLQVVEDRLVALERLMKKHGPTLEDVLARQRDLRADLDALDLDEAQMGHLLAEEDALRGRFLEAASALTASRRDAGRKLAAALARELEALAMPDCQI